MRKRKIISKIDLSSAKDLLERRLLNHSHYIIICLEPEVTLLIKNVKRLPGKIYNRFEVANQPIVCFNTCQIKEL